MSLAEVLILKRQQRNDVVVSGDLLVDLRNIFDLQINDDPVWQRLILRGIVGWSWATSANSKSSSRRLTYQSDSKVIWKPTLSR